MIKVFISQAMKDLPTETIEANRAKAIEVLKTKYPDITVIDSYVKDTRRDKKPVWYLGYSLQKLSEADIAVFVNTVEAPWFFARGCNTEYTICQQYGIKRVIVNIDRETVTLVDKDC